MSETVNLIDATGEIVDVPLSIFDIAETDTEAEESGKWFNDIFENGTNVNVKLRRFTSKTSIKVRQKLEAPYRRKLKSGKLPDEVNAQLMIDQLAEGVIVDWAGVRDRDGKDIPYTVDTAKAILGKLPDLVRILGAITIQMDNFRMSKREDIAGN